MEPGKETLEDEMKGNLPEDGGRGGIVWGRVKRDHKGHTYGRIWALNVYEEIVSLKRGKRYG